MIHVYEDKKIKGNVPRYIGIIPKILLTIFVTMIKQNVDIEEYIIFEQVTEKSREKLYKKTLNKCAPYLRRRDGRLKKF